MAGHANAAAFVAPDTLQRALAKGMRLGTYLDRNDAFGKFEALGNLIVTGPIKLTSMIFGRYRFCSWYRLFLIGYSHFLHELKYGC